MVEITDAKILTGYRTDHSSISLQLEFGKFKKGRSYWKMNNSLLKDHSYVESVKNKIMEVKLQYVNADQLRDRTISEIPNQELIFDINDQLFFETLMFEIRGKTIAYSSMIKKEENKREEDLI